MNDKCYLGIKAPLPYNVKRSDERNGNGLTWDEWYALATKAGTPKNEFGSLISLDNLYLNFWLGTDPAYYSAKKNVRNL